MGTTVPGLYPSLGGEGAVVETERYDRPYVLHPDPCLGKALGEFLGPAPVAPVSVCLAGPGTHPVCFQGAHVGPPRLQSACGVEGGVGGIKLYLLGLRPEPPPWGLCTQAVVP